MAGFGDAHDPIAGQSKDEVVELAPGNRSQPARASPVDGSFAADQVAGVVTGVRLASEFRGFPVRRVDTRGNRQRYLRRGFSPTQSSDDCIPLSGP